MFPEFQQLTERSRVDKTGLDSTILKDDLRAKDNGSNHEI